MKCPQCKAEGSLVISFFYEKSYNCKIKQDGTVSKKCTKSDTNSLEWNCINCSNCGMYTTNQMDDYYVDENNKIVFKEDKQWTEQ